jgi:cell division transport system ATP-binding protein
LNRSGTSVVIATHDQALMELFPARRLRLEGGHLAVEDPGR